VTFEAAPWPVNTTPLQASPAVTCLLSPSCPRAQPPPTAEAALSSSCSPLTALHASPHARLSRRLVGRLPCPPEGCLRRR
jgi:hypothetical protein